MDIQSQGLDLRFGGVENFGYSFQFIVNMPQFTDEGPAMFIFEKDLACVHQQELLGLDRGCHGERMFDEVFVHNRNQIPPSKRSVSDPDEVFGMHATKDITDQQILDKLKVCFKADVMPDKIKQSLVATKELCLELNPDDPLEGFVTHGIHRLLQELEDLNIGVRKWSKKPKKKD